MSPANPRFSSSCWRKRPFPAHSEVPAGAACTPHIPRLPSTCYSLVYGVPCPGRWAAGPSQLGPLEVSWGENIRNGSLALDVWIEFHQSKDIGDGAPPRSPHPVWLRKVEAWSCPCKPLATPGRLSETRSFYQVLAGGKEATISPPSAASRRGPDPSFGFLLLVLPGVLSTGLPQSAKQNASAYPDHAVNQRRRRTMRQVAFQHLPLLKVLLWGCWGSLPRLKL